MRLHKGKTFLAPPRLFKAERALYFPNLYGRTLEKDDPGPKDTTPVLEDSISVVTIFSSAWAEGQVATFVSRDVNPDLYKAIDESGELAQLVQINVEDNILKNWIVKIFMPSLRKRLGTAKQWAKYFLVRKGVTDEIKDSIGLLNS